MTAIEILIDQIVKSPGTLLTHRVTAAPVAAWSPPGAEDPQWGWYDFQQALAGLEVIEHQVSSALCQAVFPNPWRRPAR